MRHIYANHAHIFPEFARKDGTIAVLRQVMQENSIEKCICACTHSCKSTLFRV